MPAKDPHRHDYTELGYIREVGTIRIILTRKCACGVQQAFECGDKDKMRRLYAQLKRKEGSSEHRSGLIQDNSGRVPNASATSSAKTS